MAPAQETIARRTITRYRDAASGRFVPDEIGRRRPARTIRDVMDGSAGGGHTRTIERDVRNGQFVATGTAARSPAVTVVERVRIGH